MTDMLSRIISVQAVSFGFLKINWDDGYEGVIDIRPLIEKGDIFETVRDKENFFTVKLSDFGHSVYWKDKDGYVIDLGADGLRRDCEKQEQIHNLMAV